MGYDERLARKKLASERIELVLAKKKLKELKSLEPEILPEVLVEPTPVEIKKPKKLKKKVLASE